MPKSAKRWSKTFGPYGARVLLFEERNGVINAQVFDPKLKAQGPYPYRRISLKTRDKRQAEKWAWKQVAKLEDRINETSQPRKPLLKTVFAEYLRYRTPQKGEDRQYTDRRSVEMWAKVLGASKDLRKLTRRE